MLVFCTGIPRSGSSWAYNVCRLILEHDSSYPLECGWFGGQQQIDEYIQRRLSASENEANILVKGHSPGPQSIELIRTQKAKHIYTYRDPRDSLCSYIDFMHNSEFESALRGAIGNLIQLIGYRRNTNTLFIRYEDMKHDAFQEIRRTARYLGLPLSEDAYCNIAEKTSLEASQKIISEISQASVEQVMQEAEFTLDRVTLLHTNHISKAQGKTGRWREEFSAEQQLAVNIAMQPWLIDLEYESQESMYSLLWRLMSQTDWQSLAQRRIATGDYKQAVTLYEIGIDLEPTVTEHYWYLGLSLFLMQQEEAAQFIWFSVLSQLAEGDLDRAVGELTAILQSQVKTQIERGFPDVALRLKDAIPETVLS